MEAQLRHVPGHHLSRRGRLAQLVLGERAENQQRGVALVVEGLRVLLELDRREEGAEVVVHDPRGGLTIRAGHTACIQRKVSLYLYCSLYQACCNTL